MPRFQLGKLFKTNWQRKPRDEIGNIIGAEAQQSEPPPKLSNAEAAEHLLQKLDSMTQQKPIEAPPGEAVGIVSASAVSELAQAIATAATQAAAAAATATAATP